MKSESLHVLQELNLPEVAHQIAPLDENVQAELERELGELDVSFFKKTFANYQKIQKSIPSQGESLSSILPLNDDFCELDTTQLFHQSALAERFIRDGKAGILILAGGMGSRLGHQAPKGTFPITPVTEKSLFQVHFEKIRVLRRHYQTPLCVCVMTNQESHAPICDFFRKNDWFGLPKSDIFFFPQNSIPAVNPENGSFYWTANGHICLGPDGHGGMITALKSSGAFDFLQSHGVETLNTFHVDNPLVPILHEQFLAAHHEHKSEMSSVVVEKVDGMELVGNVVRSADHPDSLKVIEYMDFPGELAMKTRARGGLKFWAGSIGIHLIQMDFLNRMEEKIRLEPDFLPYHLPLKKITANSGEVWAIKPERFLFDILPFAKHPLVGLAKRRDEVFTTLKKSSIPVRNHLSELYASWLRRLGAHLPKNALVEIAPDFALDFATLQEKVSASTIFNNEKIFLS